MLQVASDLAQALIEAVNGRKVSLTGRLQRISANGNVDEYRHVISICSAGLNTVLTPATRTDTACGHAANRQYYYHECCPWEIVFLSILPLWHLAFSTMMIE